LNPEPVTTHPARRGPRRARRPFRPQSARPLPGGQSELPFAEAALAVDVSQLTFDALELHPALLASVADRGFTIPTSVQAQVIPIARQGRDVMASAETGTGKTAAFVLPILDRLLRRQAPGASANQPRRTSVLILTPTRELAVQIEDDIQGFAYHSSICSAAVYGGVPSEAQDRALRAGVDIVVATPGRLMDHMRCQAADFSGLDVLVLDEADRMMDMGFWPDVQRIVSTLPRDRQTLLFSATLPDDVLRQAETIVRDARIIATGTRNGPARTITHAVESVAADRKAEWLGQFLKRQMGPILVFARTKRGAERLATRLASAGVKVAALHADRTQAQRSAALEGLRSGRYTTLVATDVAARGLDIDSITHVINFEVPTTREAYVHRVGRTGRANLTGVAVTLMAPEERRALAALARDVGITLAPTA
jgi:ATP-dependent RNA helicase RhlE